MFSRLYDIMNNRTRRLTCDSNYELSFLRDMLSWWRAWKGECFSRVKQHIKSPKSADLYKGFFTQHASDDLECFIECTILLLEQCARRNQEGQLQYIFARLISSDIIENAFGDIRHVAAERNLTSQVTYTSQRIVTAGNTHVKHSKTASRKRNAASVRDEDIERMYTPCDQVRQFRETREDKILATKQQVWQVNENGNWVCV